MSVALPLRHAVVLSLTLMWAALPGLALRTPPIPGCFSRGLAVAELNQRETPAILAWDNATWLVWSAAEGGTLVPLLGRVEPSGKLGDPKAILLSGDILYAGAPQLVATEGGPWLLFLAREATDAPRRLYTVPLGPEGEVLSSPHQLEPDSGAGIRSYFSLAKAGEIWIAAEDVAGALWLFHMDAATAEVDTWYLGRGEAPVLAVGKGLHLVWAAETGGLYRLMYSQLAREGPSPPVELKGFSLATGTIPSPPALALGADWVYAAVGFEYRGGELAGTAEVWICAFPQGHPQECTSYSLRLPGVAPDQYPLRAAGLCLAPLPPQATVRPTNLYLPRGAPETEGYALLTLGAKLYQGNSSQVQPVLVALAGGQPVAWAPIAASRDFSYATVLDRSSRGWHAAWLDMLGYGEYRIYYAATPAEEREALDRVGWDDVAYFLGTAASGIVGGLALIPLFLMASVPGLVLIFFHYVIGGEESLRYRWPKFLLALSLLPYLILKLALAGMFGGMPFAQWLSQPVASAAARVIPFVPVMLGTAALFLYIRRSAEPTVFPAWATFVVSDLLFTVIIVGPAFAGG